MNQDKNMFDTFTSKKPSEGMGIVMLLSVSFLKRFHGEFYTQRGWHWYAPPALTPCSR